MKPDTFTELIRRKLESIRPDFTERDWTRMQRSLHQAGLSGPPGGVGGVLTGQPWLMAAAGIGTAVLLTLAVWQRAEINDLRQQVARTASPAPAAATSTNPAQTGSPTQPDQQPRSADTVYITRYIPVQATPAPERAATNQHTDIDKYAPVNRSAETARSAETDLAGTPGYAPKNALLPGRVDGSQRIARTTQTTTLPENPNGTQVQRGRVEKNSPAMGQDEVIDGSGNQKVVSDKEISRGGALTPPTVRSGKGGGKPVPIATVGETGAEAGAVALAADGPALVQDAVATPSRLQPLQPDAIDWNARLAHRFRRVRPVPVVVAQPQAPESQPVVSTTTTFRLGISTDLRSHYWNTGLVAETVLNSRWVLSAGLVRSSTLFGAYVTDDDYDYQTRRNFRREYAPGFDPKRDIYGIDVRSVRYQIPLSLGYRIPINSSLALLPSVGAYLDLSNTMYVVFSYRKPFPRPGFDVLSFSEKQTPTLLNAYTAGAALEWHKKHWVAQGGLLLARPLYSDLNGETSTALGGRVRLLYQF